MPRQKKMRINNRSPFHGKGRTAYKVENKVDETTVYIYDEISWFGVDAQAFVKDFNKIEAKVINLRVNSPGGSVFDGTTIFNAVKQHPSKTIAHIDGLAASIASVIVMAADEVIMAENAFLMIHEPWSMVVGGSEDMRKEAELLDKVRGTIAKTYTDKSGKEEKEVFDLMADETWFTAEEALENGFVDSIVKDSKDNEQKATAFDLSVFAKVPDELTNINKEPTARDVETALKDIGCTQKQAKSIMSEGFKTDLRDVADTEIPPVEEEDLRDVTSPEPIKDKTFELLAEAERIAPSART